MINGLSSTVNSSYDTSTTSRNNDNSLSYTQQQTLESILSNYDSDNLSSSDAQEIVSAFQEAGINPSKSLADSMQSLGFDAQELASLAGINGPQNGSMPPPPPPPQKEEVDSISDILSELLDSDDDDDDKNNSIFSSNSYNPNSNNVSSFESILDYTSRILSLNDEAKGEVMKLFENYKSDNTELSSKDVSNIIKNSLQDILSDSSNYNSTSFYA